MYETRFGMTGLPFQLSPDPRFYFDTGGHRRARAALREVLGRESGIVVVSGEIGAGKTTLIRSLLDEMDASTTRVAQLVSTQLDGDELMSAVALAFGIAVDADRPEAHAAQLLTYLLQAGRQACAAVLVIDEAQNLHADAFQRLTALLRYGSRRVPLQVFLVGQPELTQAIAAPGLSALHTHLRLSCHLGPIAAEETGPYVEHRLRKVGWSGTPSFEVGVFDEIFRCSGGIPRRINMLCNRLLLSRYLEAETKIDVPAVLRTARELGAELGSAEPLETDWRAAPWTHDSPPPLNGTPVADVVTAGGGAGPLLLLVASVADHLRAGCLMRAFSALRESPPRRIVCVREDDASARHAWLFAGLGLEADTIVLGLDEDEGDAVATLSEAFTRVVEQLRPRAVIVFEGSPAAWAGATVARDHAVTVVHVGAGVREAGLEDAADAARKGTDALADLLYTADAEASRALAAESIAAERIHCVGSLLIDAVRLALGAAAGPAIPRVHTTSVEPVFAEGGRYAVVVVGHPFNVADRRAASAVLDMLHDVGRDIPLVWPMEPWLQRRIRQLRLEASVEAAGVRRLPPQSYVDHIALLRGATCVLTDSWDVQEETTALGVPCITIGAVPARSITVTRGSNTVAGRDRVQATRLVWDCIFNGGKRGHEPDLWDGKAGARIARYLATWLRIAEPAAAPRVDP